MELGKEGKGGGEERRGEERREGDGLGSLEIPT